MWHEIVTTIMISRLSAVVRLFSKRWAAAFLALISASPILGDESNIARKAGPTNGRAPPARAFAPTFARLSE